MTGLRTIPNSNLEMLEYKCFCVRLYARELGAVFNRRIGLLTLIYINVHLQAWLQHHTATCSMYAILLSDYSLILTFIQISLNDYLYYSTVDCRFYSTVFQLNKNFFFVMQIPYIILYKYLVKAVNWKLQIYTSIVNFFCTDIKGLLQKILKHWLST